MELGYITILRRKPVIEQLYLKHEPMINKIVKNYTKAYSCRFDDVKCEANYAFMSCVKSYDNTKGKFTTWLYNYIQWSLNAWIQNEKKYYKYQTALTRKVQEYKKEKPKGKSLEQITKILSSDAKKVIQLVYETPEEIEALCVMDKALSKELKTYLKNNGYTTFKITSIWKEIKQALK